MNTQKKKIFLHLETNIIPTFIIINFGQIDYNQDCCLKTFIHSQNLYGCRNGMHTVH